MAIKTKTLSVITAFFVALSLTFSPLAMAASSQPAIYGSCAKSGAQAQSLKCGPIKGAKGLFWLPTGTLGTFSNFGDAYDSKLNSVPNSQNFDIWTLSKGNWVFQDHTALTVQKVLSFSNLNGGSSTESIVDVAMFAKWSGSIRSHLCANADLNCRLGGGSIYTIVDSKNKRTDITWPTTGDVLSDALTTNDESKSASLSDFQVRFGSDQNTLIVRECDAANEVDIGGLRGGQQPYCSIKVVDLVKKTQKSIFITSCSHLCSAGMLNSYVRGLVTNGNHIFTIMCEHAHSPIKDSTTSSFTYSNSGPLTGDCNLIDLSSTSSSISANNGLVETGVQGNFKKIVNIGTNEAIYNLQEWNIGGSLYVTYISDNSYTVENVNSDQDFSPLDGDLINYFDDFKLNQNGVSNNACVVKISDGTMNCFPAPETAESTPLDYFSLIWPTNSKSAPTLGIMYQHSSDTSNLSIVTLSDGTVSSIRTSCDYQSDCSPLAHPYSIPTSGFPN
jgi:hypothetical protein